MNANATRRIGLVALAVTLLLCAALDAHAQEGVKVHGDWTITVRGPDGAVEARHQFKNELVKGGGIDSGELLLAQLLLGDVTAEQWFVELSGLFNGCHERDGPSAACRIVESGGPWTGHSTDLKVAVPASGPNARKMVLTGSLKVQQAGQVEGVAALVSFCDNTGASGPCSNRRTTRFTRKTLPSAIPVSVGRTIDVEVIISFS